MEKKSLKTRCNRFVQYRNRENQQRKPKQKRITDFFNAINEDEITPVQIQETDIIHFAQNNHQKRIASTELITNLTEKHEHFVIMGQEPSTYGYNVTGINTGEMRDTRVIYYVIATRKSRCFSTLVHM